MSDESGEESEPSVEPEKAEAPKESSPRPSEGEGDEEGEGGLGPALLAGVGILAVVAALVFWPTDDDDKGKAGAKDKQTASNAQGRGGKKDRTGANAKGPGGVGKRDADEATRRAATDRQAQVEAKRNPAVRLPQGIGMAPSVPQEEPPPKFEDTEEEIAWYEAKLVRANSHLNMRRKATERLERMKKQVEEKNDAQELAQYDKKAEVVNDNFRRAEKKVADLEKKIEELRGE